MHFVCGCLREPEVLWSFGFFIMNKHYIQCTCRFEDVMFGRKWINQAQLVFFVFLFLIFLNFMWGSNPAID